MNQNWPADLEQQLTAQKQELTNRVDKIRADIGRGLDADSKEQATQLENQEVLDALANEATGEINKINAALQRMDDGSYGNCLTCGEAIDHRRLAVRPYAGRCIACASND